MSYLRPLIAKASGINPAILAFICYAVWGFAALVYLPMQAFNAHPLEIIAHRCIWATLLTAIMITYFKQWPLALHALRSPKILGLLALTSCLMALNWGLFVWAVLNKHIIESALGYYLNPLMNMAVGALLFKERLDKFGYGAICFAVIGVLIQGFALGHIPYIALILGISFTIYGAIRKTLDVDSVSGLFIECLILFLPAVIFFIGFEAMGLGHFFALPNALWLVFTGPVTVFPLVLFSFVAKRLRLSTMGFIQFVGPTIGFLIGIFMGEPFTPLRALSFGFIWVGVAIFALGAFMRYKNHSLKTAI
jgi:chloramphenicol-sensitive protein RarD